MERRWVVEKKQFQWCPAESRLKMVSHTDTRCDAFDAALRCAHRLAQDIWWRNLSEDDLWDDDVEPPKLRTRDEMPPYELSEGGLYVEHDGNQTVKIQVLEVPVDEEVVPADDDK
jgi:hypothetical protein